MPLSAVTLVSASGAFQGSIRTTTAAYSIEPDGPAYVVRQVDTRLTPPELEPLEPPVGAFAAAAVAADPPMAGDDASTIDVLVLYTPGARASAGGSDAAVQARIALGVTETNTAYANSGITPRLRLVGTQRTELHRGRDVRRPDRRCNRTRAWARCAIQSAPTWCRSSSPTAPKPAASAT